MRLGGYRGRMKKNCQQPVSLPAVLVESLLLFFQNVADLFEQDFLSRRFRWSLGSFFRFSFKRVHCFQHQEDCEGDDQKIDHCRNEFAVADDSSPAEILRVFSLFFRFSF